MRLGNITQIYGGIVDKCCETDVHCHRDADSLSSAEIDDVNGGGIIDLKTTDVMVINADTSRDHTVSVFNTDNTLRSKVTTHIGVDRISETVTVDQTDDKFSNLRTIINYNTCGGRSAECNSLDGTLKLFTKS